MLNKGTITARELAKRFSVSTRTIYRDIDALSSAGVPVYMRAIVLKLRFKAQVINRLYEYFDDSFLIPNDDGSLVEVLEPEYMFNTIAQRIRQALKIYES